MINSTYYKTSDTALATYLLIQNFKLVDIDYSASRYEYYFLNADDILDKAQTYMTGRARVDPAVYQRINRQLARVIKNTGQWVE